MIPWTSIAMPVIYLVSNYRSLRHKAGKGAPCPAMIKQWNF
jgi:hypothetical protein